MADSPVTIGSNVWIYAFASDQDTRKHNHAKLLIERSDLRISVQIIGEICNALLRKVKVSESRVQELIKAFYERFEPFEIRSKDQLLRASHLRERYNLSHWDSLIVLAAPELDCSILYSEDMQNGLSIENKVTIRNPFSDYS